MEYTSNFDTHYELWFHFKGSVCVYVCLCKAVPFYRFNKIKYCDIEILKIFYDINLNKLYSVQLNDYYNGLSLSLSLYHPYTTLLLFCGSN